MPIMLNNQPINYWLINNNWFAEICLLIIEFNLLLNELDKCYIVIPPSKFTLTAQWLHKN